MYKRSIRPKKKKVSSEVREARRRSKLVREVEKTLAGREYFSRPVRWGKAVPAILVRPDPSKPSKAKSRSDLQLDRAILQQLEKKLAYGGVLALTEKPTRPVRNRTRTQLHKIKRYGVAITMARHARGRLSKLKDESGSPIPDGWMVYVPNWTHVTDVIKAAAYGAAIPEGRRHTFTLNLAPEITEKALRSPKGFAKFMQDRLGRELRKAFPGRHVGFVFVVEGAYDLQGVEELIPFHLHGAVEVPQVILEDGYGSDLLLEEEAVEDALRKAGGQLPAEKRARQLKIDRMYNLLGWFAYLAKARFATTHALASARKMARIPKPASEGVVAATEKLRADGQRWFNDARKNETQFPIRTRRKRKSRTPPA